MVQASFDRDQVEPGDPVSVTVDTGEPGRALIGLAVVDESVLALGRSRLHLAQVFAELESRFLEPRAEIHEEEGGGPPAGGGPFMGWGGPQRPPSSGALDVIEGVGLGVAASDNVTVRRGQDFQRDWLEAVDDFGPLPAPPDVAVGGAPADEDGGSPEGGGSETVRVRQYFPETWVWEPVLFTDESGRLTVELEAPDNITGW